MKKVLVIDDVPEVAQIVSATLQVAGFVPLVALDGRTGLDLARKEHPDLILCDIHMPDLDGYDTLKALRQDEPTATTPFIFLSGMGDRPDVRRGMELGADDYLAKPFTATELVATVRTRLAKKEELDRQTEKRLDEVRGSITLALPHELRTPLVGILGLSSILIEDHATVEREELLETAQNIHASACRLQRLIENFLIYAQIQLLNSTPGVSPLGTAGTPTATERLVADAARAMAKEAGREADLLCDTVPCSLLILAEHLNRIVEEIVSNAFKFSLPASPVFVKTQVNHQTFILTVTDHGRGLSQEQIARIGPHMQFDRRIHEQQGAGLGLVIARRLTELLGGQWALDSIPGCQTVVQIIFPCPL